jgi:hypothetical protein
MWKKILTVSLVLVMVLSFTACAEEAEEEVELPSAQEIVDGVIHSIDEIRTYQYDMDGTLDMTIEGVAQVATFGYSYNCTLDFENRQARMDITIESIAETGQRELGWGGEHYFIDGMLYTKPKDPEEETIWMKEEAPEEWWEEQQQMGFESQIELLEAAQVQVIGSESVSDIDCYVLEVTPDLQQLWKLHNNLTFQETPDVTEEYLQEIFHSFSIKQWVAKDTYFLMKAEIDISTEFPPETPGPSTIDIAMVLLAYNYNQPVSIVLPLEAEEAVQFVEVTDENLEVAIRDALGKPTGVTITTAELAGPTTLEADVSGIADLSGLEYCTSLIELYLGDNQISDITSLENLTSLIKLGLGGNQISDISPLQNLTSLTKLDLGDNQISDISPISNLTNLTELRISQNQISDISPLVENSGLDTGDEVWLQDNNLDLSEVSEDMENVRALEDRGVVVHY